MAKDVHAVLEKIAEEQGGMSRKVPSNFFSIFYYFIVLF